MANEIIAISIPQIPDDIEIFEFIKALLITHQFVYIDMAVEPDTNCIRYRFQRQP
jgi:hypothetical protein